VESRGKGQGKEDAKGESEMPGIIVGVDGSVYSRHALEWAIGEAAIRGAPLTVLTVPEGSTGFWDPSAYPSLKDPSLVERAAKEAQAETDHALDSLGPGPRPSSVTVRVATGTPADELVHAARDADMIVVGCRGAGGFKKLLMGSVTVHVTHHARCPVVVIPADCT